MQRQYVKGIPEQVTHLVSLRSGTDALPGTFTEVLDSLQHSSK